MDSNAMATSTRSEIWNTITHTLASEFSDMDDIAQATRLVLRLLLAALLGGLLGWEREAAGKAAGVRTHMLVSMGSALFVLLALQTGAQANEASRVMQGVIAGIGFLGAGTILKESTNGQSPPQVRGLTTAAGIWLTAAIGVACGLGEETTAVLSAVLAWVVLAAVPWLAGRGVLHGKPAAMPAPSASTPSADRVAAAHCAQDVKHKSTPAPTHSD